MSDPDRPDIFSSPPPGLQLLAAALGSARIISRLLKEAVFPPVPDPLTVLERELLEVQRGEL